MFGKLAVVVFTIASLALGTAALASTTSRAQPDENNGLITVNYAEDDARRASLPRSAPDAAHSHAARCLTAREEVHGRPCA